MDNWQQHPDDNEPFETFDQEHADVADMDESKSTMQSTGLTRQPRTVQLSDVETLSLKTTAKIAKDCLNKSEALANSLSSLDGTNPNATAMDQIVHQLAGRSLPSILRLFQDDRDEDSVNNILDLNRALTAILLDCSRCLVAAERSVRQAGHDSMTDTVTINRLHSHDELLATILALIPVDLNETAIDIAKRLKHDVKQIAVSLRTTTADDQSPRIDQETQRLKPFRQALEQLRQAQSDSSDLGVNEQLEVDNIKDDSQKFINSPKRPPDYVGSEGIMKSMVNAKKPTLLMLSAACGDLQGVQSAVEGGFNINTEASAGSLLCNCDGCDNFVNFPYSCQRCAYEICESCRSRGLTCKGAAEGHTLERSSDINPRSTLLSIAVEEGHKELVEYLLQHGADPNSGGGIQSSIHNQRQMIAELLIEHGAAVDTPGRTFTTALLAAAKKGDASLTKLLIERGANVNNTTMPDDTEHISAAAAGYQSPIVAAVRNRHFTVSKMLLEAGADPNVEFGTGGTAMNFALLGEQSVPTMEYKWHDIIALLKSHGAKTAEELKENPSSSTEPATKENKRDEIWLLCPFESLQANQPPVLLPESEWNQHVMETHVRVPFWRCDLCRPNDKPYDFNDPSQIAQHLHTVHGEIVKQKFEYDRRYLRSTTRSLPQSCGFCNENLADCLTWDKALNHIATHIKYALSMRYPEQVLRDWQTDGSLYAWVRFWRLHEIPEQVDILARPYIRCVCGLNANEPLPYDDEQETGKSFVSCKSCGVLQHGECVGVSPENATGYTCEECTQETITETAQSPSRMLLPPPESSNKRQDSTFRQTAGSYPRARRLSNEETLSPSNVSSAEKDLGVKMGETNLSACSNSLLDCAQKLTAMYELVADAPRSSKRDLFGTTDDAKVRLKATITELETLSRTLNSLENYRRSGPHSAIGLHKCASQCRAHTVGIMSAVDKAVKHYDEKPKMNTKSLARLLGAGQVPYDIERATNSMRRAIQECLSTEQNQESNQVDESRTSLLGRIEMSLQSLGNDPVRAAAEAGTNLHRVHAQQEIQKDTKNLRDSTHSRRFDAVDEQSTDTDPIRAGLQVARLGSRVCGDLLDWYKSSKRTAAKASASDEDINALQYLFGVAELVLGRSLDTIPGSDIKIGEGLTAVDFDVQRLDKQLQRLKATLQNTSRQPINRDFTVLTIVQQLTEDLEGTRELLASVEKAYWESQGNREQLDAPTLLNKERSSRKI